MPYVSQANILWNNCHAALNLWYFNYITLDYIISAVNHSAKFPSSPGVTVAVPHQMDSRVEVSQSPSIETRGKVSP